MAGRRLTPRLPQADGRLPGHGRDDGLHQAAAGAHRPVREAAGRTHTGPSHVLCHGIHSGRIRNAAAGRKPHVSTHKGGRQRPPSGESGRNGRVRAGFDSGDVRSRPVTDNCASRRRAYMGAASRSVPWTAERAESARGRGHPGPHANCIFPHAGGPVAVRAEALSATT